MLRQWLTKFARGKELVASILEHKNSIASKATAEFEAVDMAIENELYRKLIF